ncbi:MULTISPECIES: SMEK domain-containing protein [Providencia]|uniref:SMEK domain-containing protein n=1 Tax=Providencia TaxID=586 RepID=UPI00197FFD94|nr:SMEK domain-containing protein [Providencia stuartii]MBN4864781.1 SMEK domain-containing protein [Providencia stuartii]MBN4873773.1 SMEK domain-containing protein [Providencia stuartii]MBN4878464.1 SMEK domain-containing protein [Providencia stuartii]MBN4883303.1 SMEK domain-containing protein [Providencia stuartii]
MLNKELAIKEIIYWITHLSTSAKLGGKIHFFDLNIVAEDFYADLLNIIYGWNLVNLNHAELNRAAIDLGDRQQKIAVQITSNRRKDKLQKTINLFNEHNLSKEYSTLKIVIIGEKTRLNSTLNLPLGINFNAKNDILDDTTLISDISSLSIDKLHKIISLIKKDVIPRRDVELSLKQSDLDVLKIYKNYFDRPALKDAWAAEGDFTAFKAALTDLITLMNTGILQEKPITKSRFQIDDIDIKNELKSVAESLRILRELFNLHVRNSDIDLENNTFNSKAIYKADAFDKLKKSIINNLNTVLINNSLSPIT